MSLGYHEALAISKPFRQYVFGNTNPKRLNRMQQSLIMEHLELLKDFNIVMISSDELIVDQIIVELRNQTLDDLKNVDWKVPVKFKIFETKYFENYTDKVRIDHIMDDNFNLKYKELKEVHGSRFFIHFKSLILEEELDEKDLLFKNDQKLAKWIL